MPEDKEDITKDDLYCSLSPKVSEDVDKDNAYSEAIEWALTRDDIKNIALTGIYGAGKSSVLEKFEKNHKTDTQYSFFNVSLATFDTYKPDTKNIEECILQQIFYQVDSKKIPHSRFKKITHLPDKTIEKYEGMILTLVILGMLVIYPQLYNVPFSLISKMNENGYPLVIATILLIVFILLSLFFVDLLIKFLYRKIKLTKLSINKVGFEVVNKESEESRSVFNKYLDEIIYFFEATKYNIIVFEDLDRFDNTEIFVKLRELNTIINNYENIKRKIVFVYAIKDDIFTDKERTKFFDFVIPIIPFLNSSNSFEILDKKIKSIGLEKVNISNEYLMDISPFINDMRLLDNIINEFKLYKIKLDKSDIIDEKLFSIISYKNICPNDFALLQNNKGFVYNTLNKKSEIIAEKLSEIKVNLANIQKEQKEINTLQYSRLSDLENQLLGMILKKINRYVTSSSIKLTIDNENPISVQNFINAEEIEYSEIETVKISYEYYTSYSQYSDTFIADEELLNYMQEIEMKKDRLNTFLSDNEKVFKLKKEALNDEKINLEVSTYAELAKSFNIKHKEEYNDEKYDIAKFMLRRGYIDETFQNYISYFHQGNLSIEENNYILSLKNEKNLGVLYKLNNIKLLLVKLDKRDFDHTNFYNVYLVDYMIDNYKLNDEHFKICFEAVFKSLCKHTEENKNFISIMLGFLNKTYSHEIFVNKVSLLINIMSQRWSGAYNLINDSTKEKSDILMQKLVLLETLKCLDPSEIIDQNINNCIVETILIYGDFITLVSDVECIIDKISILKLKFKHLIIEGKNEITDYIFENNCWVFSDNYMQNLYKLYFKEDKDFYIKNFSVINNSQYTWLKKFININCTAYVQYMLSLEQNCQDDFKALILLLGAENLSLELKNKIIEKEEYIFDDWDSLSTEVWDKLIVEKKIKMNWDNIEKYHDIEFGPTDIIMNFIEHGKEILANEPISSHDLAINILGKENIAIYFLHNKAFDNLTFDFSEIQDLDENRYCLIINKKLLNYTVENFNGLTEVFPNLIPLFLNDAYEDEDFDLTECVFGNEVVEKIFCSDLNLSLKKSVLTHLKIENLVSKVIRIIIYFVADFCDLEDLEFSKIGTLISKVDSIEPCVHLFNTKFNDLTDNQVVSLLDKHCELKNLLVYRKQVGVEINDDSYKFLNELCSRDIISSYNEKFGKLVAYTKQNISV